MAAAPLHLWDAHTHVQRMAPEIAGSAPSIRIVACATSRADWAAVAALRDCHPHLGVHPWWAADFDADADAGALRTALEHDARVHVGETGLDRCPRGLAATPWDKQLAAFRAQVAMAADLGRAVSVHCVRCADDLIGQLRAHAALPPAMLFHSWPGNPTQTAALLDLLAPRCRAVLFSFQGAVVTAAVQAWRERASPAPAEASAHKPAGHPASKQTMSVLARLPLAHLAFETDAPDQGFDADLLDPAYQAWSDAVLAAAGWSPIVSTRFAAGGSSATGATDDTPAACTASGHTPARVAVTKDTPAPCTASDHTPARVAAVYVAAAAWRVHKSSSHAKGVEAGGGDAVGGWPGVDATAAAVVELAAAVDANMRRYLRDG
jgi:Tat protein secretion system quality control protein TatD with DNase activity